MKYFFDSKINLLDKFATKITEVDTIKNEPMFFNSSLEFAYNFNNNPITKSFIDALPKDWLGDEVVFDSRVHMLMKGWFPCIPGYHHDDVDRGDNGQPDYDKLIYKSEHICGLVNSHIAPTNFALGQCYMPKVNEGEIIYKEWHKEVEKQITEDILEIFPAPDRQLIYFNWQTFHTGVRAINNGWRWFGRVSRNTNRTKNITNEVRRQVQVYLEFPMEGW